MKAIQNPSVDRLFETFLNLENLEECYAYFEDLCTVKELQDMAQRLDTAILLSKGCSYQQIAEQVNQQMALLQVAVDTGKNALLDAATTMYSIRTENTAE